MRMDQEYVKQSYALAWVFFKKNLSASLIVVATLLLFTLALKIPTVGIFSLLLLAIFSFSIQIYVAKNIYQDNENISFFELLFSYFKLAIGAFLGQVTIQLLLSGALYFVFSSLVGMDTFEAIRAGTLAQNQLYPVYMTIGAIAAIAFLIIMLWIYIVPMMLAYAYEAETVMEAFLAALVIFNLQVWKSSFREKYYVLISMFQLTATALFSAVALILSNIYLLPLAIFSIYIFLVYLAVVSKMAKSAVV